MPRLGKWGNSCGLRVNAHVLECAGLKIGDEVLVRVIDSGDILLRPVKARPGASVSVGGESVNIPARVTKEEW